MSIDFVSDTRFTAIGLSGSGKTCFIMGLYDQMATGVNGFNLVTTNERAKQLEDMLEILDSKKGQDRFPTGTSLNDVNEYQFTLLFKNKKIMSVDWIDYGGNILHDKGETNSDVYSELEKSIEKSSAMYIFIDGELLCHAETDKKIREVARKCARRINPFIVEFSAKHNECLPPIIFVVTKSDLCAPYIKEGEIDRIIAECFSSVFLNDSIVYITAVSYGTHISDDNYSGEAEPNLMYLPFLLGLYHEYQNCCLKIISDINEKMGKKQSEISKYNCAISAENKKWFEFLKDYGRISKMTEMKQNAEHEVEQLSVMLNAYNGMLRAVSDQLLRESNNFTTVRKGQAILFEPDF